ncbi:ArsA family ATPase [Pimelobacter simplex]|uniref:arsenite-transporting ATPase n=1 Tax=Nocardioides simplex TaxID=2045 RepID=A0A0A1DP46_NOCSI|nr:ArsA family ATPase [Pimelobacter simplex]AIY17160.1 Arsenical pump-driving ATPase [Pimelobacter simplex]MCG8151667.1 TRC40/GET3/ArsA family transport-energizing ATPase [Pimelobacter simplex]GEB13154.1 arsenic-transporting ATPase [Pimelobacter simplex]SFM48724.1 arsenite efflux ATP-binding protein ArsA [Pimelobacter simplex]
MRIVLFTGKGGVGKSTVAAGTAALAAARGLRTLVISTDAAHSLADAYGAVSTGSTNGGAEPTEVAPGLFLQQVDAQLRFEQSWADIQRYLLSVLDAVGMDPVAAEEMTVIPGAEEVLALLELRQHARSGRWDVVVVDCAPTAETLRLLALPEALGWYLERLLPIQRRLVKALRPVLNRAAGVPMPGDAVFDAITRLHGELDDVHALLSGPEASVRLVLTPEQVVLAEARRAYTSLCLFGYRVDGVVANRVFPDGDGDPWRAGWVAAQAGVLREVAQSFGGLPVWTSRYQAAEPVGVDALAALATSLYDGADPLAVPAGDGPFRVTRGETGAVAHLALPFVTRAEVDLARNGDELVMTVGSYRRLMTLPPGLARLRVAGASVVEGELRVRFAEPDPAAMGGQHHAR